VGDAEGEVARVAANVKAALSSEPLLLEHCSVTVVTVTLHRPEPLLIELGSVAVMAVTLHTSPRATPP